MSSLPLIPFLSIASPILSSLPSRHAVLLYLYRILNVFAWHYFQIINKYSSRTPKVPFVSPASDAPNHSDETTGLHRLPPEIRLEIYKHVFPSHRVVQPKFDLGKLRARAGLLSTTDAGNASISSSTQLQTQHIRSDTDPSSSVLPLVLENGGSFLQQHNSSPGAVTTKSPGRLICGDGEAFDASQGFEFLGNGAYTALMRSSRTLYREVLEELYASHTFSFFGVGMLRFFCDKAAPAGVGLVRNVHLGIPVRVDDNKKSKKTESDIVDAMKILKHEFHSLRALDVELVLYWGSPSDEIELWTWLMNTAFQELERKGLRDFVLKVSVLRRSNKSLKPGRCETRVENWGAWNETEYRDLKRRIMSKEKPDDNVQ